MFFNPFEWENDIAKLFWEKLNELNGKKPRNIDDFEIILRHQVNQTSDSLEKNCWYLTKTDEMLIVAMQLHEIRNAICFAMKMEVTIMYLESMNTVILSKEESIFPTGNFIQTAIHLKEFIEDIIKIKLGCDKIELMDKDGQLIKLCNNTETLSKNPLFSVSTTMQSVISDYLNVDESIENLSNIRTSIPMSASNEEISINMDVFIAEIVENCTNKICSFLEEKFNVSNVPVAPSVAEPKRRGRKPKAPEPQPVASETNNKVNEFPKMRFPSDFKPATNVRKQGETVYTENLRRALSKCNIKASLMRIVENNESETWWNKLLSQSLPKIDMATKEEEYRNAARYLLERDYSNQ